MSAAKPRRRAKRKREKRDDGTTVTRFKWTGKRNSGRSSVRYELPDGETTGHTWRDSKGRVRCWLTMPWDQPQRCGAHARSTGKPCAAKALANGRCRLHGGMSTGPRTAAGRARAVANLMQYRPAASNDCGTIGAGKSLT